MVVVVGVGGGGGYDDVDISRAWESIREYIKVKSQII
jgi:hypothetical protein